jgi:flagellar motor component MotA
MKNTTWDTVEPISNYVWFASEAMITLGMIGTVAGFLIMLNTAFSGLDVNDIRNVQEAISDMAIGMSTALVTTLVGLVCSTLIKVQMIVYENSSNGNPQI